MVARDAGEIEDDDIDSLLVQLADKVIDRAEGGVEFARVVQGRALGAGEGLAQGEVFGRQADPQGAPLDLALGEMARLQPGRELVPHVDQGAADQADEDDDRACELLAQDEEEEDQSDDGEGAAAQDDEQRP